MARSWHTTSPQTPCFSACTAGGTNARLGGGLELRMLLVEKSKRLAPAK